jgi:hypothetical protein
MRLLCFPLALDSYSITFLIFGYFSNSQYLTEHLFKDVDNFYKLYKTGKNIKLMHSNTTFF